MFPNDNNYGYDFNKGEFNKRSEDFDRNFKKAAAGVGIAWVISALMSFAFLIALVYVAYHFISKVW